MKPHLPEVSNQAEWNSTYHTGYLSWMLSAYSCLQNTVHFITQEGNSFTYLLNVREQQRDHSVCYLLCSSKSWHNGGSIKHKENSQLSGVAGTLWKDLDHRKKNRLFGHQGKWKCIYYGFPQILKNLKTPACKFQQLLLAQLKSSPLTAATLARGYCSSAQTQQMEWRLM